MTESYDITVPDVIPVVAAEGTFNAPTTKVGFQPTPKMYKFLQSILKSGQVGNVEVWCEDVGIRASTLEEWKQSPEFLPWLSRELDYSLMLYKAEWLKIGLTKMHDDKKIWAEMKSLFYPRGVMFTSPEESTDRSKLEEEVTAIFAAVATRAKRKR